MHYSAVILLTYQTSSILDGRWEAFVPKCLIMSEAMGPKGGEGDGGNEGNKEKKPSEV